MLVGRAPAGRRYLSHEDEAIRLCVRQDGDLAALAYRLGRSPDALRLHAQYLGLHRPPPRRRWAEWEDAVIRDGYTSALPYAEIARQLPHRSPTSLAARARKLDLISYARRWSIHDDERLVQLSSRGSTLENVAQRLGRTPEAIRRHASRLGINPPSRRRRPAMLGGGPARRTSCCACTTRSIPPASPSCSDARTLPSAGDCARLDCVPVPSTPRTIRGTAGLPRPPRSAPSKPARGQSDPGGLGRSTPTAAGRLFLRARGRCACRAAAAPSRPGSAPGPSRRSRSPRGSHPDRVATALVS